MTLIFTILNLLVPESAIDKNAQHKQKETLHKCQDCGRSFTKNSYLLRHRLKHTGERPFECRICGARFQRNYHLTRHRWIHKSEQHRPFECWQCHKE